MTGSAPHDSAGEPTCSGIRIVAMSIKDGRELTVTLDEQLGCPTCGQTGSRWVIPGFQGPRLQHRPNGRPDPGE